MSLYNLSLCVGTFIFLCYLHGGNSLDCYHCNVTSTSQSNVGDPCKNKSTLQRCQDPAVCLEASYTYNYLSIPATTTTKMQTCYINAGGKECEIFMKNIKTIHSYNADFSESCRICRENGCNRERSIIMSSASTVSSCFIISIFALITSKLF